MKKFTLKKFACVAALSLLLPVVSNAYTLVLRSGRQVVIPDQFVVEHSTLTYVAGTNIQVTVQLVTVDIPATERANKEASGAFMKRVKATPPQRVQTVGSTVTNHDLEKFRKTRVESEVAYETRRKELGLPSIEESRRAALASAERTQEQLLNNRSAEEQAETYWRGRASELRAEISATDARIGFVRTRLSELPVNFSFSTIGPVFTSVSPILRGQITTGVPSFGVVDQLARGAVIQQPAFGNRGVRFGASVGFGNGPRGRVFMNTFPGRRFGGFNRSRFSSVAALPIYSNDNYYERVALSTELNELLSYQVGLRARWLALEEEARRAGAYPGWLR